MEGVSKLGRATWPLVGGFLIVNNCDTVQIDVWGLILALSAVAANLFNTGITCARGTFVVVGDEAPCGACDVEHIRAFARYVYDRSESATIGHPPPARANPVATILLSRVRNWFLIGKESSLVRLSMPAFV